MTLSKEECLAASEYVKGFTEQAQRHIDDVIKTQVTVAFELVPYGSSECPGVMFISVHLIISYDGHDVRINNFPDWPSFKGYCHPVDILHHVSKVIVDREYIKATHLLLIQYEEKKLL